MRRDYAILCDKCAPYFVTLSVTLSVTLASSHLESAAKLLNWLQSISNRGSRNGSEFTDVCVKLTPVTQSVTLHA